MENGANFFETNTIFHGGDAAEFWLPIFLLPIAASEIWRWKFS